MRLINPEDKVPAAMFKRIKEKLELACTILAAHPEQNGNPLLFATSAGRVHELVPDGKISHNTHLLDTHFPSFIFLKQV